jgi:hygromycin-B 7''-O-kinase
VHGPGVGLFVTRGDPHLMARLTDSYGHAFEPAELLAYTLLHVYSNLPWYLRELDAPAEAWFAAA